MNDVLAITQPRITRAASVRPGRASLRAQEWSHSSGAQPSAWRPHLAERAYTAELVHAERARAARRTAPERAHPQAEPAHLQFGARP